MIVHIKELLLKNPTVTVGYIFVIMNVVSPMPDAVLKMCSDVKVFYSFYPVIAQSLASEFYLDSLIV